MGGWSNWRKKALFQVLPQCSYVPSGTAASYEFKYMYYDAILCVGQVVVRWSNGRKKAANFSVLPQLLFWHGIFITIFIWLQFNVLWCYAVCGLKGRKGWQVIKSEEAGFFHVFPQCSDTGASYIFIYEFKFVVQWYAVCELKGRKGCGQIMGGTKQLVSVRFLNFSFSNNIHMNSMPCTMMGYA